MGRWRLRKTRDRILVEGQEACQATSGHFLCFSQKMLWRTDQPGHAQVLELSRNLPLTTERQGAATSPSENGKVPARAGQTQNDGPKDPAGETKPRSLFKEFRAILEIPALQRLEGTRRKIKLRGTAGEKWAGSAEDPSPGLAGAGGRARGHQLPSKMHGSELKGAKQTVKAAKNQGGQSYPTSVPRRGRGLGGAHGAPAPLPAQAHRGKDRSQHVLPGNPSPGERGLGWGASDGSPLAPLLLGGNKDWSPPPASPGGLRRILPLPHDVTERTLPLQVGRCESNAAAALGESPSPSFASPRARSFADVPVPGVKAPWAAPAA